MPACGSRCPPAPRRRDASPPHPQRETEGGRIGRSHISMEDFAYAPFAPLGGLGKATKLFGDELSVLLDELTQELVA